MIGDYVMLFGVAYEGSEMQAVIAYPHTGGFALGTFDVAQRGGAYVETLRSEARLTADEVRRLAQQRGEKRYLQVTEDNWYALAGVERPPERDYEVIFNLYSSGMSDFVVVRDRRTGSCHRGRYSPPMQVGERRRLSVTAEPLTADQLRRLAVQSDDARADRWRG